MFIIIVIYTIYLFVIFLFYYRHTKEDDIALKTRQIALAICQNKDPFVQGLSSVLEKHLKRKDAIFETFMGYLSKDKYLKGLVKRILDPEEPGTLVTSFILCTRGPKCKAKFEILNRALVCFVQQHKMNKVTQGLADIPEFQNEYQPTSWDTMLKNLFSYFAEKGIQYKHPNDFLNIRGTYTAVLDHKFAIIAKSRSDFGSLPNRSAIDLASYP